MQKSVPNESAPGDKARAHLAAIVDSSDDAIISTTLEGILTSWNRGAETLYGYRAPDAVGQHISFLVPPERLGELQQIRDRIWQGERVEHLETVRIAKGGRPIDVSLTISPILDAEGGITGVSAIARDITGRIRMERSLAESERRYRTLVEMAQDAVIVCQDDRFIYANCAALGVFGANSLDQLQQSSFLELVHTDDRNVFGGLIQQLLDAESVPLSELKLLRLSGQELTVEISFSLIDYRGIPSIQMVARDVTERKRAEREREDMLKELGFQRSRFEAVVSQMPIGVMIAEAPSGGLSYWNEESRRIFRHRFESVQSFADYTQCKVRRLDGSPLPVEEFPLARVLLKGETIIGEEFQIQRGDGELGLVSVNAVPIRDISGQIVSGLAAFSDVTQRKSAEKALSESEERLKLALDAAEMGSCDIDTRTGRGVWSRRHYLLLGYEPPPDGAATASIEMWKSRIHPDDLELVNHVLVQSRRERAFFRSEHRIIRADNGQLEWVNVQGRFICDPTGAACRFIGVIFDVSERKSIEEALRRSEQRFRLMADSMPQIAWTAEADGTVDYINAHFEVYTGMERHAQKIQENRLHPERLIFEIVHPDDVKQAARAWQDAIHSGGIYQTENRIRRSDGAYRWHLSRAIPERDEDGRIIKWYGTATDINELRETQEALKTSEATLKLAIEITGLGIFDLDLGTRKGGWSEIAKRHYGLPPEAEADLDMLMAGVHPEDRVRVEHIATDALNPAGAGIYSAQYRTVGIGDGKLRWLTMRGRVIFSEEGRPLRLVGACLDITDIVKAQAALKEEIIERLRAVEELGRQEQLLIRQGRLAAMGEMIGNIAHQWRQPLNTLGLIVQELPHYYERNLFSKEYLDASVTRAMQVINYMSKTIDGFRNFFGPDKEKELFRASEVLAKTVAIVESAFNELKLEIEVGADADIFIFGYPNEFSQVILNILMNAKDAILERRVTKPRVAVRLFRENGRAVLTISDNAGGIMPEIIDKIFDPYFTTKAPDKGTGIGLFMSKTIIEKNMNGTLTVRNTEQGAEFRIEV